MNLLLAGFVAGLMTMFDLDQTFYVPRSINRRFQLYGWMAAFVLANALLAAGTYQLIRNTDPFRDWNQTLAALVAGAGYLAIIHTKFATFNWHGQEIPFGVDLLYQGGKRLVYKRINRIARDARFDETRVLASQLDLDELVRRARLSIVQDRLLSDDQKERDKRWIVSVLEDQQADDMYMRMLIANYILSGDR